MDGGVRRLEGEVASAVEAMTAVDMADMLRLLEEATAEDIEAARGDMHRIDLVEARTP